MLKSRDLSSQLEFKRGQRRHSWLLCLKVRYRGFKVEYDKMVATVEFLTLG